MDHARGTTGRDRKPTASFARPKATVETIASGDVALVNVVGLVDEQFAGFGKVSGEARNVIINVTGMARMTSFGVRQWLKSIEALPKTISNLYLLGCPTFFVDQLNMVLNFGAQATVLTVIAPYTCPSCGVESGETIDVLTDRDVLVRGGVPEKDCTRCGGKLEFDETPESYFAFLSKYTAAGIEPSAAQLLRDRGLYTALDSDTEKPPRVIKLVHGSVTYFRIKGTIGAMFRARPFLVGAEGEVVIDLAEILRVDPSGLREWRRLLKSLAGQVPAVTLVDVGDTLLRHAADSFAIAHNIAVSSVLTQYRCADCGRTSQESHGLKDTAWPLQFAQHVCSTCGGATRNISPPEILAVLQRANTNAPAASVKVIAQREELLSRALTDANVAQAGESANASLADDAILGKYKIVHRLSAGGMAEVFLAKQIGMGGFEKPVALKRIQRKLLETRHQAIDMFLNEAKIAGRLMHPNIVQVLDVGEVGGALYLAMEYVRGKDLRDVIKMLRANGAALPLGAVCYVVREIAQALHHAYWSTDLAGKQLSVVHRDVSPHNVMLGFDGTVKLLDFGVAASAVTEQAETTIVGKWLYMSPEHTMSRKIDHRSDLFSLGVVTYLLCTGYMPFSGADPKEIVRKIRAGQYTPITELAPNVPRELVQLVGRLLASLPDDRPNNGLEVVSTLDEIARQYRMEYSGADMAALLKSTFPDVLEEVSDLVEIAPASDDNEPATEYDPVTHSSRSLTPDPSSRSLSGSRTPSPTPAAKPSQTHVAARWPRMNVATLIAIIGLLAIATYVLVAR